MRKERKEVGRCLLATSKQIPLRAELVLSPSGILSNGEVLAAHTGIRLYKPQSRATAFYSLKIRSEQFIASLAKCSIVALEMCVGT